jgi:hypothetical protein
MNNSKVKKIFQKGLPLFIGGLLLISILIIINSTIAQSTDLPSSAPTSQVINPIGEIEELKLALQSKNLSSEDRSVVEAKLAAALSEATQRALPKLESTLVLSKKQTALMQDTKPPLITQKGRPTGLITNPPMDAITRNAIFSTIWVQQINEVYYQVGAGYLANDKNQGVVYLLIENPRKLIEFLASGKTGKLTITGKEGELIQISSESGLVLYFDLRNQQLLGANGKNAILNTPTPLPAYP